MSNVFRILAKIEYIKENNNVSVPSGVKKKKTQFMNVVLYRQWRARGARAKWSMIPGWSISHVRVFQEVGLH